MAKGCQSLYKHVASAENCAWDYKCHNRFLNEYIPENAFFKSREEWGKHLRVKSKPIDMIRDCSTGQHLHQPATVWLQSNRFAEASPFASLSP